MHTLNRPCPKHGNRAASDAGRWLSMHRTSMGTVVYYRCTCGRPAVSVHPAASFMSAANRFAARDRMLAGTGVTTRMCTVDGLWTSLIEIGTGPPLVLLHGGIECGGAFWAPVLARLGERHRVVAPDLPGLGESSPADALDVNRFAAWFDGLLRVADIERPTVVAHSLGGSLAAGAATRRNDGIRRLVIYAGPAVGPYRMPWRLRYVAMRFALRPNRRNGERYDRFAMRDLDATRRRDPGWFAAYESYNLVQAAKPHVKRTMNRLVDTGTKAIPGTELDGITAPVSLLWGRDDRMVPLRTAEIASARHDWPLHVIDDAAHAPHVEQPERFVDALTRIGTYD